MSLKRLLCVASTVVFTTLTYTAATAQAAPDAAKCEKQCGKSGVGRPTTKSWCEKNKCKEILTAPQTTAKPAE